MNANTVLAGVCALTLSLGLFGCGGTAATSEEDDSTATEAAVEETTETEAETESEAGAEAAPDPEPASVNETDDVTVNAIVIDDAYVNEEHPTSKRVFVFATLHPKSENLEVSAYSGSLIVTSGGNETTYNTALEENATDAGTTELAWCSSYYYDNVIKDVYMGEEFKMAFVFDVPEAALAEDSTLSLNSEFDDFDTEDLSMIYADVLHVEGAEALSQAADPDGYEAEMTARAEADADTAAAVSSAIAGYDYYAYVGTLRNGFTFGWNYDFTNDVSGYAGTYRVLNGYLELTYSEGAQNTVLLPYTLENGAVSMHITETISL